MSLRCHQLEFATTQHSHGHWDYLWFHGHRPVSRLPLHCQRTL